MDEEKIFGVIYIIILIFGIIFFIYYKYKKNKNEKLVLNNSKNLKMLLNINSKYLFYPIYNSNLKINFSAYSKKNLDLISGEDVILDYISNNTNYLYTDLKYTRENRKIYYNYLTEINNLNYCMDNDFFINNKIKPKRFYEIERTLIRKYMFRDIYDITVYVYMHYVSPQGRNSYLKSKFFNTFELLHLLHIYEQNIANQSIARVERAKMSSSLRYDILRRDGFRCQICGATAQDGVTLHVDHIFPVSKGGKTEPSNLRTLCDRCNIGKSDKIE